MALTPLVLVKSHRYRKLAHFGEFRIQESGVRIQELQNEESLPVFDGSSGSNLRRNQLPVKSIKISLSGMRELTVPPS